MKLDKKLDEKLDASFYRLRARHWSADTATSSHSTSGSCCCCTYAPMWTTTVDHVPAGPLMIICMTCLHEIIMLQSYNKYTTFVVIVITIKIGFA